MTDSIAALDQDVEQHVQESMQDKEFAHAGTRSVP